MSDNRNVSTNKQVLIEFIKESVGIEKGMGQTLRSLRKDPQSVLMGYLDGTPGIVSPFRILFSGFALWIIFNSLIIDWYSIWENGMRAYLEFLAQYLEKDNVVETIDSPFVRMYIQMAGDLFTRWFVPFVILVAPLSAFFTSKWTKSMGVGFKELLIVNSYVMGTSIFVYLVVSILAAIDIVALIVASLIIVILGLFGRNYFQFVQAKYFFAENGKSIEKMIARGNILSVLLVISFLITGYISWFLFLENADLFGR